MQFVCNRHFAPFTTLVVAFWLAHIGTMHAAEPTPAATVHPVAYAVGAPRQVTLGDGPFRAAMAANVKYLLANSEPDDMLLLFRRLAGVSKPPGRLVGWENAYPAHAAQFLMGAGNTLRWQEQPELRRRLDRLIDGIKQCRGKDGSLLVPGVNAKLANQWGYSMQMFAHGMVAAAQAGNRDAYKLLAAAHRTYAGMLRTNPSDFALTTDLNYQGHSASLLTYFSPLGSPDDLKLAEQYFVRTPWMDALARRQPEAVWKSCPKWPHCYEIIAFEAYLDHYRASGDKRYLDAMLGAWDLIHDNWEHVGGAIAICEGQAYPPKCYPLTARRHVGELCGSVFWIRFNQRLHRLFPDDERYVNELEKSIYNVCLAGQEPHGHGMQYHLLLQGRKREGDVFAQGPVPSQRHTCCEGMSTWLYGNLPEYVFAQHAAGLSVNLFHSASTSWERGQNKIGLAMATRFPEQGAVRLRLSAVKPTRMALRVRIPRWCPADVPLAVNGQKALTGRPGSFVMLDRTWNDGDQVSFELPLALRAHRYVGEDKLPGAERYAVEYGPLLLACVGPIVPTLRHDPAHLSDWLKPDSARPLHFRIDGLASHYFAPYWHVGNDEPFTCYPVMGGK
jgi:uncharacterized protein